jgi:hypothetical protein
MRCLAFAFVLNAGKKSAPDVLAQSAPQRLDRQHDLFHLANA